MGILEWVFMSKQLEDIHFVLHNLGLLWRESLYSMSKRYSSDCLKIILKASTPGHPYGDLHLHTYVFPCPSSNWLVASCKLTMIQMMVILPNMSVINFCSFHSFSITFPQPINLRIHTILVYCKWLLWNTALHTLQINCLLISLCKYSPQTCDMLIVDTVSKTFQVHCLPPTNHSLWLF